MFLTIIPYVANNSPCSSTHAANVAGMSGSFTTALDDVAETGVPVLSKNVPYIVCISYGLLFILNSKLPPISLNKTLECSMW